MADRQGTSMQISIDDEGQNAKVALVGRLDIQGAEVVALPLATLSGAKQNLLLDMSQVSFLASIGIRHLVTATKALARKGGQLILIGSQEPIREVLTTAGLASMIAMVKSETEARAMLAR
jgi:anti-anti-sigma factor